LGASGGEQLDDAIEQIARAFAVDRRDRDGLAESQTRKLAVYRGKRARRFALIGDEHDSAPCSAQNLGDVLVERIQSDLRVDDEDDRVGFLSRGFGLTAGCLGEDFTVRGIRVRIDAGGVDYTEGAAAPLAQRVKPVAGHARRVLHDRQPLTDQAVEEGALSDVRTADDGNGGRAEHGARWGRSLLHRLSFRNAYEEPPPNRTIDAPDLH
jgi:hypothetical protein